MEIIENYEPKEILMSISRDFLRESGKYGSDENCKKLCLFVEVLFE